MTPTNPITLIPARLASTRLPDKPLADIAGKPMIVRVWERAMAARIGRVVVAAEDAAICDAIKAAGGEAVLTGSHHQSGSDRIAEALAQLDPGFAHDAVINVQGDLPTLDPALVRASLSLLDDDAVDIGTLAAEITELHEKYDPNVVKAVVEREPGAPRGRALYFTRASAPTGDGPLLHHIGLYAYRRDALTRFVAQPPAALERAERLEQLRALAMGMRIDVAIVDTVPLGVDTATDLERARRLWSQA
ncbi:MAG: kdsB [Rhodospirillales bacterium]|nr:kdsB [Rhodospirillales bacterium]